MNEEEFFRKREPDWRRLNDLLKYASGSLNALSRTETEELLALYRRCSTDLAIARTQDANLHVVEGLNDLVRRAYMVIYRRPSKKFTTVLYEALVSTTQSVRRQAIFVWISVALFVIFTLWTGFLTSTNPQVKQALIPPEMQSNAKGWLHGLPDRTSDQSAMMTGFYASHNGLIAVFEPGLAAGTFGLFAFYSIFMNAAAMGALGALMAHAGRLHILIFSILPHGVPELSGFMISAAAGLAMGWALINPGRRSRSEALAAVGQDAIRMAAAAVILTWIAAPIEGWFSYSSRIPLAAKAAFGAVEIIAWTLFWVGFARDRDPVASD